MLTEAPPPGGSPTARTVEEEFLALLCADEQLLRAEFDAIIAAEWPATPDRPGTSRPGVPPDRRRHRHDRGPRARIGHPRPPDGDRQARQRSPPAELTGPPNTESR